MTTAERLEQLPLTESGMLLAAALRLYQDRKPTLAFAAKFAGIDREAFMGGMMAHGIPLNYTLEDVEEDPMYARSCHRP